MANVTFSVFSTYVVLCSCVVWSHFIVSTILGISHILTYIRVIQTDKTSFLHAFFASERSFGKCPEVFAEIAVADGFFSTKNKRFCRFIFYFGSLQSTLTKPSCSREIFGKNFTRIFQNGYIFKTKFLCQHPWVFLRPQLVKINPCYR